MNFSKRILSAALILTLLTSIGASAAKYDIKSSVIDSVSIGDEFSACTMDSCDPKLERILRNNKFTVAKWRSEVMETAGYELYAMNAEEGKYIYLTLTDAPPDVDNTQDIDSQSHRLIGDYNIIKDMDDRQAALGRVKDALMKQGISEDKISSIQWINTGDYYSMDYIEYFCFFDEQYFHRYETIYDATRIELQFTSPKEFTFEEKTAHFEILKNIKYDTKIDYTEAEQALDETLQQKLEDETYSGENTKLLRILIPLSIVIIIIFAVLLTVNAQSKKRKRYRWSDEDDEE